MNKQILTTLIASAGLMMGQSTINSREANQQQRIGQGVESGSLTAGEAARLEHGEARINREVQTDRAANGGRLTQQERNQVNGQLNRESNRIYDDKHNGNTAPYGNNEIDARRQNQQERIGQGIEKGQLSAGQAARLESKEAGINRQVRGERAANHGALTPSERRQTNRELNSASRQIHRARQR
jgi:hypothetical protein